MAQTWHDLLFAHWPIAPATMRALVPPKLTLDTYDGQCWVGVVPFWMSGVRPRGIPSIPRLSQSPELNVRTYVTVDGKAGVFFFSLDAGSRTGGIDGAGFVPPALFFRGDGSTGGGQRNCLSLHAPQFEGGISRPLWPQRPPRC